MLDNLFTFNKRRDTRIDIHANVCAFSMVKYEPSTQQILSGDCLVVQLINIGTSGLGVRHNNTFKKGEIYEFRTKYSIEDKKCLYCPAFDEITDELLLRPFIGKVIWRSASIAGISLIMLHPKDREYLKKLCLEPR